MLAYQTLPEDECDEAMRSLDAYLQAQGLTKVEQSGSHTHLLSWQQGRLCLADLGAEAATPTCVDFSDPALQYRRQTFGRKQGVARAVGLHRRSELTVVDATAGLGRDAYILAALGCRVTLLERSPLVYALLSDGLRRALLSNDDALRTAVERMSLLQADGRDYARAIQRGEQPRPDVIYLDPMFPTRRKQAKVKKDMASLQSLLGPDQDVIDLLTAARQAAGQRVVVKRPGGKGGDAELPACDFQVTGKSSHFDVYLCRDA